MSRGRGFYVAGTDTEVGKTVLSAALVCALRARGLDAGYLKPVGTDAMAEGGARVNPDAAAVKSVAGLDDPVRDLNPICLEHALCPLAAARLEGVTLGSDAMLAALDAGLSRHAVTVVEGVGGLMVPLAEGMTFLDLMAQRPLPVVLAARPGLGTINHSLLSLEALARRGLKVLGFCYLGPESLSGPAANSSLIAEFSGAAFLGALPRLDDPLGDGQALARAVEEHLDLDAVLAGI